MSAQRPARAARRRCLHLPATVELTPLCPTALHLLQWEPIPVELPPLNLTEDEISVGQYGLGVVAPALAAAGPLAEEMQALFTWSTVGIRLDRPNNLEHSLNEL